MNTNMNTNMNSMKMNTNNNMNNSFGGQSSYGNVSQTNSAPPSSYNRPPVSHANYGGVSNEPLISSIKSLAMYQTRWTIKARVLSKGPIRTWDKGTSQGKLFSVDVQDQDGCVKMTFFNEEVDKFHQLLAVDKAYFFSNGQPKQINPRYARPGQELEISMGRDSDVRFCSDDQCLIPKMTYEFVPIEQLSSFDANSVVDVIGVVSSLSDVANFTSSRTGQNLNKRTVTLVDQSRSTIELALWGETALNFKGENRQVLALKAARLTEFNGRSLSTGQGTHMEIMPDVPEAHTLQMWYNSIGQDQPVVSLTSSVVGGGFSRSDQFMALGHIKEANLGMGIKPDYLASRGLLTQIKHDVTWNYPSCPGCRKKLLRDDMANRWTCGQCKENNNQETYYDTPQYRYILTMQFNDFSGSAWISTFDEEAVKIMGVDASTLFNLKEGDPAAFERAFQDANFKEYNLKLRCKAEMWQEETRNKINLTLCSPVNWSKECAIVLADIKAYQL